MNTLLRLFTTATLALACQGTPRLNAADGKRLAPHMIKAAQMISEMLR